MSATKQDALLVLACCGADERRRMLGDLDYASRIRGLNVDIVRAAGGLVPEVYAGVDGPFPNRYAELELTRRAIERDDLPDPFEEGTSP